MNRQYTVKFQTAPRTKVVVDLIKFKAPWAHSNLTGRFCLSGMSMVYLYESLCLFYLSSNFDFDVSVYYAYELRISRANQQTKVEPRVWSIVDCKLAKPPPRHSPSFPVISFLVAQPRC